MTAPNLKPCPFCGGDKNMICKTDYDGGDAYAVSCRYPECHGGIFMLGYGYFSTKDQAIAAWNTRAIDPAAIREAALREAAAVAQRGSDVLGERMRNAKDKKEKRDWQSMLFAAVDINHAILALIGEKK